MVESSSCLFLTDGSGAYLEFSKLRIYIFQVHLLAHYGRLPLDDDKGWSERNIVALSRQT